MHSWYRELPLPAEKYDDFPESSPMPVYDYSTLYHYEPPPEEPLRWFAEESPVARPVGQPHPQGLVVTKKPNAQARKVKVKSSTEDEAKPRRPLSAYNLFFQAERKKLLAKLPVRPSGKPRRSHGKMGFVEMARTIGHSWKSIDETTKAFYDSLALLEKEKYKREMKEYKRRKEAATSLNSSQCTSSQEFFPQSDLIHFPTVVNQDEPLHFPNYVEDLTALSQQLDDDMIDLLVKAFS